MGAHRQGRREEVLELRAQQGEGGREERAQPASGMVRTLGVRGEQW